jgi:hypothetical protein
VRTTEIYFRTRPALKEAAKRAAALDQRTLSSLLEWLITEHCKQRGIAIDRPVRKRNG